MSYRLVFGEDIRAKIDRFTAEATAQGQGSRFSRAVRSLHERLGADPMGAGELKYHLTTGTPDFMVSEEPLVFHYAVYEAAQAVWVVRVERLGGAGE
jgi:hypothetical protein